MPDPQNISDGGTEAVVAESNPETRAAAFTAALHAAPDPGDREGMRTYLHALADAGLSAVFLNPGTKLPKTDLRTPVHRAADDLALQEEAREAGLIGWEMRKASKGGVYLATSDRDRLDDYLAEYTKRFGKGKVVNIGVVLGPSGLIMVDTDTPEQEAAIRKLTGSAPVVLTPGTKLPDGNGWAHHGGGHRYYTVPVDKWLPEKGEQKLDGGGVAYWGQTKQAVLPPSVRPEGAYVVVPEGRVEPAPDWLLDAILKPTRNTKRDNGTGGSKVGGAPYVYDPDDPITAWGATITWREILADAPGWVATGKADGCGCEIWTAPGLHASSKSATAHEHGCRLTDSTDPVLHLWTDHDCEPFDGYTNMTRLRAVALIHHGGDIAEAMSRLGIADTDNITSVKELTMTAPTALNGAIYGDSTTEADRRDEVGDAKAAAAAVMRENIGLFDESAILTGLAAFATARKVGRWSLLGGVLLRTACALPYNVVLPPIIGSEASLNLLLGFVGTSSGGKGISDNAAADAVIIKFGNYTADKLPMKPLGSGEGINREFAHTVAVPGQRRSITEFHARSALFSVRDITTLAALAKRNGSTVVGELLKCYMGEELGFTNAGRDTNVVLPRHSYRLGLSMGVQPDRAAMLLDAEARGNGLTSRILALPGTDLSVRSGTPESGVPVTLALPEELWVDPMTVDDPPLTPLGVSSGVAAVLIGAHNIKNLDVFGESDDPLSGHRGLGQLKLAALLAVMHGETTAGGIYWQWAEKLSAISEAMMAAADAASRKAEADAAHEMGRRDGHRRVAADDTQQTAMRERVRERIVGVLRQQGDWMPHSKLHVALSKPQRDYLNDTVGVLVQAGVIEAEDYTYKNSSAVRYRIAAG